MSRNTFLSPQWVRRRPLPLAHTSRHVVKTRVIKRLQRNTTMFLHCSPAVSSHLLTEFNILLWSGGHQYLAYLFHLFNIEIGNICYLSLWNTIHSLFAEHFEELQSEWLGRGREEAFKNKPKYPKPTWMLILTDSSHLQSPASPRVCSHGFSVQYTRSPFLQTSTFITKCNDEMDGWLWWRSTFTVPTAHSTRGWVGCPEARH